jgi:hypothetical protein
MPCITYLTINITAVILTNNIIAGNALHNIMWMVQGYNTAKHLTGTISQAPACRNHIPGLSNPNQLLCICEH